MSWPRTRVCSEFARDAGNDCDADGGALDRAYLYGRMTVSAAVRALSGESGSVRAVS